MIDYGKPKYINTLSDDEIMEFIKTVPNFPIFKSKTGKRTTTIYRGDNYIRVSSRDNTLMYKDQDNVVKSIMMFDYTIHGNEAMKKRYFNFMRNKFDIGAYEKDRMLYEKAKMNKEIEFNKQKIEALHSKNKDLMADYKTRAGQSVELVKTFNNKDKIKEKEFTR